MRPLLKQCYESARDAKSLASSIRKGEVRSLGITLSCTVELRTFMQQLHDLRRNFDAIESTFLRGTAREVIELLKSRAAEGAVRASKL